MKQNTNAVVQPKVATVRSLSDVHKLIGQKRKEDLFRFRTCCADPRASK